MSVETIQDQFRNRRNQNISCVYWSSPEKPRALLLISHGLTEHSMVYDFLAQDMVRKGFFVFAHDHVGHGKTDGQRAYIEDLQDLVDDSVMHIQKIREEYPDLPLFICGHSMGGTVAVHVSLNEAVKVKGIVLIAPGLASNPETATFFIVTFAKLLSKLVPQYPLVEIDYKLSTRNENVIKEIEKDELRFHGYLSARTVVTLIQAAEVISNKISEVQVPFLLLHGDADKVCHVDGARKLFELAKSSDKTIKVYPGAYHCLYKEPGGIGDDVIEKTEEWLEKRIDA